jgi:2-octaprenyl-6-methoxyphenol hydroxylase
MSQSRSKAGSRQAAAFDVIIIGGGLVGASLACALAPLRLKIALIEAVEPRAAAQPSYDDRTLALSASSCRILQGLGAWPLLEQNATPIREIQVSERGRPGRVVLNPRELSLDRFGHVVEARVLGNAVMQMLKDLEGVEFIYPAPVSMIDCDAERACVTFAREGESRTLTAQLLVGADGAESVVRAALGITVARHDYGQTAVICNVSTEKPHRGRAFECFTPTGPFALLPHVNDRCGLVWSVASEDADGLLALPDAEFLQRAQSLFGTSLGSWHKVGKRSAYPLRLVRALQDTGPHAVILGNAAHAIHPVGAQGFNLGLRDVAVLAEVIASAREEDPAADIGAPALLQAYSDWRAPDHSGTIAFSDGLARIYANPTSLAAAGRSLGLLAHALLPPLRRQLAIRQMGYGGRVPRLALGDPLGGA